MLKFPRKNSAGVTKDPSGPVCASCGKALKADHTYRIEDKKYCEDCYQRIRYGKAGSMMRAVRQQSASPIAERLRAARERLAQEELVKKKRLPRTADDSEAWLVRNLSGRLLIRASELKPQFRHLAEPGFYRIDYLTAVVMSGWTSLPVVKALADYPGAAGVRLLVFSDSGEDTAELSAEMIRQLETPPECAFMTVKGQFKADMAPILIDFFDGEAFIRVRIRTDAGLPIEQDKVDAFLEEVLDGVLLP